jgi:Zn finger protein HypA/HybF involved in hydrogenase expression
MSRGTFMEIQRTHDDLTRCWCHACNKDAGSYRQRMILCPTCGNKRCPKANDHTNACTGSNEPGQPGSAY